MSKPKKLRGGVASGTVAKCYRISGLEVRSLRGMLRLSALTLHSVATRRFPEGVLYAAHDDRGVGAFDWRDIATALNLRQNCSIH